MDQQVAVDRRTDVRVALPPVGLRATLRPGCPVLVIDISPGGTLVQVERPLRPGARVHMQIVTTLRTFTLTARVLRCAVWTVHPRDGVTYRGALQFEDRCELFWESDTRTGSRVPGRVVAEVGRPGHVLPVDGASASGPSRRNSK